MIIQHITELHPWDKNARSITKDGLERLKKQIIQLGQYKPLLITSDGTILGGNMRYRAMLELGITDIKCIVIEFLKEDEGFVAVVDGEPQRSKFYEKIEDAMMEYSLSDNDRAGYYDIEQMMKQMDEFTIDTKLYAIDFFAPVDIPTSLAKAIHPDLFKSYNVVIEATDEQEQQNIMQKLKDEGYKVKERRKK